MGTTHRHWLAGKALMMVLLGVSSYIGLKHLRDENLGPAALGANVQSKALKISRPFGCLVLIDEDPKGSRKTPPRELRPSGIG